MSYSSLTPSEKLVFIAEAITITLEDSTLSEAFADFGLTSENLSEGLALREAYITLDINQKADYGLRIEKTAVVDGLQERVEIAYRKDRGIALRVFRGQSGLAEQLSLNEKPKRKRADLIRLSRLLYKGLLENPATRAYLEPYNFTVDVLTERLNDVEALSAAMKEQQVKRAEAKLATRKRREAMDALDIWMARFLAIARQAFRGDDEQLDKLGISG